MVLMAVAAAISGAASALNQYFGLNYYIGIVIVGALVLLLTIFGADLVRKVSTYMGIAILVTAITIYTIGIFKSKTLFTVMSADFSAVGFKNIPKAILNAFTYAGFQCVTLPTMIACGTPLKGKKELLEVDVDLIRHELRCARSLGIHADVVERLLQLG